MSNLEHFVRCSLHAKRTFSCFGFLWVDKFKCRLNVIYVGYVQVKRYLIFLFQLGCSNQQQFGSAELKASTTEVNGSSCPNSEPATLTSSLNIGMNEPNRRGRRRQVWIHFIPPPCFLEDASPPFSLTFLPLPNLSSFIEKTQGGGWVKKK